MNYLIYFFIVLVIKKTIPFKENYIENNYKNMNKSQLWNEIKSLGNPQNLKWTSSASAMNESIQSIYL